MTVLQPGNSAEIENLLALQAIAERTSRAVKQPLGSLRGRLARWFSQQTEQIPAQVKHHLNATRLLNQAVKTIQNEGKVQIPEPVIKTLEESIALIRQIAEKIPPVKFTHSLLDPECSYLDPHRLLLSESTRKAAKLPQTHTEWYLNLGLLMDIYQRSEDPELKKEIGFLAINYLAKAAPYGFEELGLPHETHAKLTRMFNHGFIEPGIAYNRESPLFDPFLCPLIAEQIAPTSGSQLFVIGNHDIEEFLPLWFSMLQTEEKKPGAKWSRQIERLVAPHIKKVLDGDFADYIDPPLCIDLTPLLEKYLYTAGKEEENDHFEQKLSSLKNELNQAIDSAAETLIMLNSEAFGTSEAKERLRVFLRSNITGVLRGQIKGAGFLKIFPLFADPKDLELPHGVYILKNCTSKVRNFARHLVDANVMRGKVKWIDFINGTGIRMTPVEGRKTLLELMPLETLLGLNHHTKVFFSNPGPNGQLYQHPSQVIETQLFKKFEAALADEQVIAENPYLRVLGQSTVHLVKGLVKEIGDKKWDELNSNPDKRQIVQNSLFRLLQHIAQAENNLKHFGTFTDAIELVHHEMTTLLTLFSPFKPEDFSPLYLQQLGCIPTHLQPYVKAGLTKSSMNTFTGIQVALRSIHAQPYRVYQPAAHFEIVRSMEKDASLEEALKSSKDSVQLYLCEFNHNINLDPAHQEYKASHVIDEVSRLLEAKPNIEHLTVAVDCTIDFVHSEKVRALLTRFSREIESGKLNFVFFRSGQKFDMLGMDHHYGSPFYMVNNGEACWKPFENLTTHAIHKTDLLSAQWFCLVNKYAPEATDDHRRAIFANTDRILANVPENLKPGNRSPVKVCTVEKGTDQCFIDIKITGEKANQITEDLKQHLYQKFAENNARIHTRGGYGYCNPNVCFFSFPDPAIHGGTMRINPGLDHRETQLIIEFLQDTAKKYS